MASSTPSPERSSAAAAGTITIGGDLTVNRLGFGAMRLTGDGIWGDPPDLDTARQVVRRAVELGVTLIDTADSYGPEVSERIIGEALYPYPDDVVVATKAGLTRSGPGEWAPNGRPEHIREACEGSLRRLQLDRIPLYQLHRIDPLVPVEDSLGTMLELHAEGKVGHIGVSEVSVAELWRCRDTVPLASVQNRFNLVDRQWEEVLDACTEAGIAFIPWFPLATGDLAKPHAAVDEVARAHGAEPGQVALAWLLARSPMMVPIPGTGSVEHLEQNVAAASLELTDADLGRLTHPGGE